MDWCKMQFNKDTVDLLIRTMQKYGWMDLPSYGTSMYPFIQKGNICRFVEFNEKTVKKGDILLYHSSSGQLIAHRFLGEKKIKDQLKYELKGDTNICSDELINQDQIIGKLVTINKQKKKVYITDLSAILWGYMIVSIPYISKILKSYLSLKESIKTRSGVSI
ncbi:signal peptidase I [Metabacillus bambusae]|uniref:Signal peptidase I n=1 Tax=Metabacillus bambusae TaxID=2795218 RepID=A0ABS3N2D6_9BACI|nr:signal peptidase I [Metabacillus bambusae]MBO1512384.1 signal peptidase I [Metabacillus bambusae]